MTSIFKDKGAVVLEEAANRLRELADNLENKPEALIQIASMGQMEREFMGNAYRAHATYLDQVRRELREGD